MTNLRDRLKVFEQGGFLPGLAGSLEVRSYLVKAPTSLGVAVICHPHPLHGGTMDNKVVTALVRAYRELGIDCLTFNFRGVGQSDGVYDEGRGELEDLLSIGAWLKAQGIDRPLYLAGFSFGSAIAAQASYSLTLEHLTLVAPPLERYQFDRENRFDCPCIIIQGGCDERVNSLQVASWQSRLRSPSELIRFPEACHFFHGQLGPFKQQLVSTFKAQMGWL